MRMKLSAVLFACLIATSMLAAPVAAHDGEHGGQVDECQNQDRGPGGDAGPPGFVADVTPDFLSGLIGGLPVPDFVKSTFGASTCS